MKNWFDIAIIGGGVIGSAVARELSRYRLDICVLEKELDVVNGVSGHNTGLLHSGILHEAGTLRTECCKEGNAEFDRVAEELDIPFRRCGKFIVGFGEDERKRLAALYQRGVRNQIPGISMLSGEELREREPNAKGDFAIFIPSAGILCPFTYTIALAENAAMNGATYLFDHEVTDISYKEERYEIQTHQGTVNARWVINCAGLYAYRFSAMLGFAAYKPNRVKGEYLILDKHVGKELSRPIYPTPNEYGAFDVHVTPTVDGNILVGPTIENIGEQIHYDATEEMIRHLGEKGAKLFPCTKKEYYIRNYAGVFPSLSNPDSGEELDFQIQTKETIPCAVNVVGINSPGLTSALPIARRVAEKIRRCEKLAVNQEFNPRRKGIIRFESQSEEMKNRLIEKDADYGEIYCRCECVTKAEIRQAIHNILGVDTVSGIKYRTRATMGRCQGGYCETRITALLEEEAGKDKKEIVLNKKDAYLFTGEVKPYDEA